MVRIENHCVGCTDLGLYCLGNLCENLNVEVHYCDRCDPKCRNPLGKVYEADGKELCEDCYNEQYGEDDD